MASATTKLKLAKHKKTDKFYNKDTMLVFNSADKDRLVIGRIENDEFVSLDQDAVELCEKHGFKYDESLVEVEEAEEEEKPAKKEAPKKAAAKSEEDEEEEKPAPAKKEAPKKAVAKSEEDDEEEEKPASKAKPSKAKKVSEEEAKPSEEEDEEPPAKPPKKEAPKKAPVKSEEEAPKKAPEKKSPNGFDTMVTLASELRELLKIGKEHYGTLSSRVAELEKEVETLKQEIAKKDKKIKAFLEA